MDDENTRPERGTKLTGKKRKFAEIYDGNGMESARAAGYTGTDESLRVQAARLLTEPLVVELIHARETAEVKPHVMSRIQRQEFWTKVANDADVSMRDRLAASRLLADSAGDFNHVRKSEVDARVEQTVLPDGLSLEELRVLARMPVADEVVIDDSDSDD